MALHRPLWTATGRVVYERKVHFFTIADVERILSRVIHVIGPDSNLLEKFIYDVSIYMLRIILDTFGQGKYVEVVYAWLLKIVGYGLGEIRKLLGDRESEQYAHDIYLAIYEYLPPGDTTPPMA